MTFHPRDWSTACFDWEQRLLNNLTLVPELPLFEEEAAHALRVFKRLHVPDMHGKPRMADVAGPWLDPIVAAIFGSYDPEITRRMIQEYFWLIPKKNTKSSSAAAIMVTALIVNRRPEGEFVLVGPTKETADISFKQASGIIRADPELDKLFHIQQHIRKITHRLTGATLQVKAADTDVITGGKQVGTLIDELHVFAEKTTAAELLVEIRGALAARPDGFLIIVTTQSKRPPVGVMKSELAKARDIRDGKLVLPLLPIIYELPVRLSQDGGWKNRKYWGCVNPNLGRSVDETFLIRELLSAEDQGAAQLALFASQHFNVEIGVSLRLDRWSGADFWEANANPDVTLESLLARCDVITAGVDGGGLDDLLGLSFVGQETATGLWLTWSHAFAHEIVFERRKQIASSMRDFEAAGELTVVKTMNDAFSQLADLVADVEATGKLAAIGFDPVGVKDIVTALAERGIEGDERIIGISQGFKLTGTIKTTEGRLSDARMIHGGQALMAWCVGNAKVEPKGNAILITKAASGSAKIDPLMSLFNAIALMAENPEPHGSVYSGARGLAVFG